jgi:hypothetical protein
MKSKSFLLKLSQNPKLMEAYNVSPKDIEYYLEGDDHKLISLTTDVGYLPNVNIRFEGGVVSMGFSSFRAKQEEWSLTKAMVDDLNACLED